MTFVPFPDMVKCVQNWSSPLGQWHNILYFWLPDFDADDIAQLAAYMEHFLSTDFKAGMTTNTTYVGVTIYDMTEENGAVYNFVHSPPIAGSDETYEKLPLSTCIGITLRTNHRGRSGRGRLYLAGFTEHVMADGLWTQGFVEDVVANYEEVRAMGATPWTWVLANHYWNGIKLTTGDFHYLTSLECRSLIPTQQRRRNFRP